MSGKKKIYCFINFQQPGGFIPIALAESGYCLAQHYSSSIGFAKIDIGYQLQPDGTPYPTAVRKHEDYAAHYPEGYELVWIDDPDNSKDEGFKQAIVNANILSDIIAKEKAAKEGK